MIVSGRIPACPFVRQTCNIADKAEELLHRGDSSFEPSLFQGGKRDCRITETADDIIDCIVTTAGTAKKKKKQPRKTKEELKMEEMQRKFEGRLMISRFRDTDAILKAEEEATQVILGTNTSK